MAGLDSSDVDVLALVLQDSIERWVRARRAVIRTWEPRPCPPRAEFVPHPDDLPTQV